MNLSEFKEAIRIRWKILIANTKFSAQESLAYVADNWGSIASTTIFMLTFLVFVSVIYGNVSQIAGYTYPEMLVFIFVAQTNFYLTWTFSIPSVVRLAQGAKFGELDLFLTKPIPHLWFVTFRKIDLVAFFSNSIPSIAPLVFLVIKNYNLNLTLQNLIFGVTLILAGQIFLHCFQFIIMIGAFWTGESHGMELLAYQLGNYSEPIPFEGYPTSLRSLGFVFLPVILHTALSASFLLGKTTSPTLFWLAIGATIIALFAKNLAWKKALKHYSSASS